MTPHPTTWAWSQPVKPAAKLVLLALIDYAGSKGRCWPGQAALAEKTGLSQRAIRDALHQLRDAGLVSWEGRGVIGTGRQSNVYIIHYTIPAGIADIDETPIPEESADIATITAKSAGQNADNGKICRKPYRQNLPPITAKSADKLSNEPSIPNGIDNRDHPPKPVKPAGMGSKPATPSPATLALPDWLPAETWQDFIGHRKALKKPMTENAGRLLLKKLASLRDEGHDPVLLLERSIINGWQGVFPNEETRAGGNDTDAGHVSSTHRHTAHGGKHEAHQRRYQSALDRNAEGQRQRAERLRRQQDAPGRTAEVIEGIFTRVQGGGG